MEMYRPTARKTQLLVQDLPDEVLIYDVERNEVHCLNGTAARVWVLCDGQRTVSEIAQQLGSDFEPETAETLVWCAIDQFAEKHLLEEALDAPVLEHKPADMTRRQMVLRLGLAVALLPVVDSIISPPAALAASPGTTPTTPTTP
ncbi:MAG: PqqD family protein [Deltaproteobacteria bacterium]|nr:PqqD family protein [Deltaproteobacteria bacterium]MBI3387141.1 PqqD family protein [Deltaproteobacteria bacterium]